MLLALQQNLWWQLTQMHYGICPHSRNLTDDQLAAIKDSDGMVGLNFAAAFLRADGRMLSGCPAGTNAAAFGLSY